MNNAGQASQMASIQLKARSYITVQQLSQSGATAGECSSKILKGCEERKDPACMFSSHQLIFSESV